MPLQLQDSKNMKQAANLLCQAFFFDFDVQGGALGNYRTGVQIPNRAIFAPPPGAGKGIFYNMYVNLAVIGAPTIQVGTSASIALLGTYKPAAEGWTHTDQNFADPAPLIMDNTLDIYVTVSTNIIRAGRFTVYLNYYFPQ